MASARSAWGIDLGNRALKAVKLVRDGAGYKVDDFEIIEHEQILSVAGDNRESLLQTALAHFIERHDTKGSVVGVSVSGQQSFARFIKLPPVEPKKIPEIVRFEAIQQIPFPLDDVEWSYQLFQEKDSPDVEVGIFAMKKDLVNRQIGYFTNLGLNVQVVQMHPLAVYNAMYHDGQIGQTTMFMDCGSENTDLIIADGESVWLRTLPIGGNNFTESLAKAFKLNFAKAEELKRNAATSKYAKQIFQAMRPVFADLVAEIQRSIGFYASVHRDARIGSGLVALGSTFQLPGLQKYLQQNLQLPVEKLDAFKATGPTDTKLAATYQEGLITLAGAYGLALQAMGEGKITSSLLPQSIRRQKMWQEKIPRFAAAAAMFVVGALGVAGSWYYNDYSYAANQPVRDEYEATLRTASRVSEEWTNNIETKGKEDYGRLVHIRALEDGRALWPVLLTDVLKIVPTAPPAELKKLPRTQRQQIVVDSLFSRYGADMKVPLAAASGPDFLKFMGQDLSQFVDQPQEEGGYGGFGGYGGGYGGYGGFGRFGGGYGGYGGGYGGYGGYGRGPMYGGGMPPYGGGGMPPVPGVPGVPGGDPMMLQGVPNADDLTAGKGENKDAKRGFLVTIRGTTPNKGKAAFVDGAFVKKLLELTSEKQYAAGKPYYFARAEVVEAGPRFKGTGGETVGAEDTAGAEELGATTEEGGKPLDPKKDRVFTDETITDDTAFTVLAIVLLDPPSPEKKADAPTDAAKTTDAK